MIFVKDFIMHYETRYLEMIYIDILNFLWVDIVGKKELLMEMQLNLIYWNII